MKKVLILILNRFKILKSSERIQKRRCKAWFEIDGDSTLRLNYDLNCNSVIYDVGGYHGDFASDIHNKYGSKIFVFEPVNFFFDLIHNRFLFNKNINVFNFGLGGYTRNEYITMLDNSSSLYSKKGEKSEILIKSIADFMFENDHQIVDLIKLNIEGGEYELLNSLIDSNLICRFKNIQVQFHDFIIDNAEEQMEALQKKISITHSLSWQYKFVWENWELKRK